MDSVPPKPLDAVKIALLDLNTADVQDIRRGLQDSAVSLEPEEVPGDRYGEPGMIVLALVLAQPVVHALAAWLLKSRRKQQIAVRTKLTLRTGEEIERVVEVDLSESRTEADVAAQFVTKLGLDPERLLDMGVDDDTA